MQFQPIMQLHDYQMKAAVHITTHRHCILAVDMGLGKTAATLVAVGIIQPKRLLIVAPKRVAETVWKQEAAKWRCAFADELVIVKGTKAKRQKMLQAADYAIISRDNLADVADMSFDMVILDELTSFKSMTASRTKAAVAVASRATRVVGLTGTFLANGAIDIYAQAAAVGLANKWHAANFYAWRATYFIDVLAHTKLQFSKWRMRGELSDLLQPINDDTFTLSAADYLSIPPVSYIKHDVELNTAAMDEYLRLSAVLALEIGGETLSFDEQQKFAKLQTLCNGFVYYGDDNSRHVVRADKSDKLEAVADFCARAAGEGETVLLFYAFIEEKQWLREMLQAAGLRVKVVGDDCDALTKWEEHEIDVLMAHPASAGHGLNLQGGGRIVVWSSMTYNYEYWAQGNARLARQGQSKAVQVHVFAAANTCEQQVYNVVAAKAAVQDEFKQLTKH